MKLAPVILFEDDRWERFLPLVYLRGLFDLRCGAGTLRHRIERLLHDGDESHVGLWCRGELAALLTEQTGRKVNQPARAGALLLNGGGFWSKLPSLREEVPAWVGTAGSQEEIACIGVDESLAAQLTPEVLLDPGRRSDILANLPSRDVSHLVQLFDWPWELVNFNASAIEADWQSAGLSGLPPSVGPGVFLVNPEQIHIGAGTRIKPCVVIDAEDGPVWIGDNVTIQPHVTLQGPCYIGDECLI
jgi:UDP-N-acetylglucosamine diphosphorylase / glucose-1-phosphate thymidylyltransferase / UDP-N-acetylgalactosamine diphosphorylase / glucosamine-1-phosphate N-acetyltransferase / galactosamine-1-phosphate N-acetyltransferase